MRIRIFLVVVMAFLATTVFGQSPSDCVPLDITFWQKELRLTRGQRLEIFRLNGKLYASINERSFTDAGHSQILLEDWRHATLGVLSPKQRREWKRIIRRYYGPQASYECE